MSFILIRIKGQTKKLITPKIQRSRLSAGSFFFHDLKVTRSNYYYVCDGLLSFFSSSPEAVKLPGYGLHIFKG